MKMKILFWDTVASFSLTLVAAAIASFIWSLVAHGSGSIDWETSFVLACAISAALASRTWAELKASY